MLNCPVVIGIVPPLAPIAFEHAEGFDKGNCSYASIRGVIEVVSN